MGASSLLVSFLRIQLTRGEEGGGGGGGGGGGMRRRMEKGNKARTQQQFREASEMEYKKPFKAKYIHTNI